MQPGDSQAVSGSNDSPAADHLVYALSKAGLITLTQSPALALGPNIQVNAIAPGAILPSPS